MKKLMLTCAVAASVAAIIAGCDSADAKKSLATSDTHYCRFLESRVAALEEYVKSERDRRRGLILENDEIEKMVQAEREERESHNAAIKAHNEWYAKACEKYGPLVYVGYDTNSASRVYRRCDGELIRNKAPKEFKPKGYNKQIMELRRKQRRKQQEAYW